MVPEFLHGKESFAARKETVEALKEAGLWLEAKNMTMV
jgi:hypothetical protein